MRDEDYYNSQIRLLKSYADRVEDKEVSDRLSTVVIDLKTLIAKCQGLEAIIKEKFHGKADGD